MSAVLSPQNGLKLDPSIAPDPSVHSDARFEPMCPYCHPPVKRGPTELERAVETAMRGATEDNVAQVIAHTKDGYVQATFRKGRRHD